MTHNYNDPLNQVCSVLITPDKMKASLQFSKIDESFSCSKAQLEEFLKANQVIHGIYQEVLEEIAQNPSKFSLHTVEIASGDWPVNGEDGSFLFYTDLDAKSKGKPLEQEDGSVDFKEVLTLSNVRKGQLIAERIPPKPGVPGMTVTGETLPAKDGKAVYFKLGKNVVTDPEKNKLYAVIDGMVTRTENDKINVFPIYEINGDVDYRIGNVNFYGTVIVRGNVLDGFKIRAEGDIRVYGGVEGAELEAGGSVIVTAGIVARNKGRVKAGKKVQCSFIQDANIYAGEEVKVLQSIMHSHVRAGKLVECLGVKGLIVGGLIQAGEKIMARTVGNTMSTVTVLEAGVLPEIRNEMFELKEKLKKNRENLIKTDQALLILDKLAAQGQLTPEKHAMHTKLTMTKSHIESENQSIKERMLELEKAMESAENASIDVYSVMYGGTKVVIGRHVRYIKDPCKRVSLRIHQGEITMLPLV